MLLLRKLHRYVGVALALLLMVQAVTGLLLRIRLGGPFAHTLHTWLKYSRSGTGIGLVISVVIAVGLAWMASSGAAMFIVMQVQKAKRARRRRET